MVIACLCASPFCAKPRVFLKYDSVHSECTPVIKKGSGLINSVFWMRKLKCPQLTGKYHSTPDSRSCPIA